ncbi:MAG: HmuY family protein [Rhodocyclaceae bacterium]
MTSGGRTASFFTNSGESGTGNGAALGSPFDYTWAQLLTWQNATTDPVNGAIPAAAWMKDAASNVFSGTNGIASGIFEYGLAGTHLLYPSYRTYLITTDNTKAITDTSAPVFALQVIGYYGGPSGTASGYPTIRWIDRASPATVNTKTIDASGSAWVYYDLANNTTTDVNGNWHIAFNRYNVKLNGGTSGAGKVGGYLAKTPASLYPSGTANETAIVAAKPADFLADLTASDLSLPSAASAWKKDAIGSQLSPAYTGSYPNALNYGWYSYYPTDAAGAAVGVTQHMLKANPDAATLVRGGEGSTYARMHVLSINYAAATPAYNGTQTWTIEFNVQP